MTWVEVLLLLYAVSCVGGVIALASHVIPNIRWDIERSDARDGFVTWGTVVCAFLTALVPVVNSLLFGAWIADMLDKPVITKRKKSSEPPCIHEG